MGARKWADVSARAGRNDLPYLLFTHVTEIREEDLPDAVCEAWHMAEFPEKQAGADLWTALFDHVGYVVDGAKRDLEAELPEVVTLYRGCTAERVGGMAWTADEAKARWFAERFRGMAGAAPTFVYRIEVPREYVLARITGRGEDEYVVDAAALDMDEEAIETLALTALAGGGTDG